MKRVVLIAGALMLVGCQPSDNQQATDVQARDEIAQLKREISAIKLEAALSRIEMSGQGAEYAVFDSQGSKAYTKLKAPTGVVLASLERVEPYLNGYNVYINVGNPSTALLHGVSGELKWGKADDLSDLQSKKFELLDSFPPGTWRVVKLTTGPADAQSIAKIVFSPTFNQLSLGRN